MSYGGTRIPPHNRKGACRKLSTYGCARRISTRRRRLLVDRSDLYVKSRRILLVDAGGSGVSELYREDDALNVTAYWQAEWAPDGRGIYFLSDRDDDYHIYYLAASVGGGEPRRITSGDFAVAHFTVNKDAIHYVANVPRPEDRQLFRIGLEGGEPEQRTERAGTHDPVISPDGRLAADMFSSDRMPPELFLVSDTGEHRLTQSPRPEFYEHTWVPAQYVTFPSHVDGVTLHGRMLLPPALDERRKFPVIVGSVYSNTVRNQWGGRNAHPLWGLEQYLLQQGYILFVVDIRGSWGHGRELRRGIRLDYGGIDVEDLHSGVKYLETLDYADTSRVGIWGSSYGGLLTCMSLFKKPGIYKAGVAGAPATNVLSRPDRRDACDDVALGRARCLRKARRLSPMPQGSVIRFSSFTVCAIASCSTRTRSRSSSV